jgi:hypothetical protein
MPASASRFHSNRLGARPRITDTQDTHLRHTGSVLHASGREGLQQDQQARGLQNNSNGYPAAMARGTNGPFRGIAREVVRLVATSNPDVAMSRSDWWTRTEYPLTALAVLFLGAYAWPILQPPLSHPLHQLCTVPVEHPTLPH